MVSLATIAGVALLFRAPAPAEPPRIAVVGKPAVEVARPGPTDELLRQETELRDLRPLFLPTNHNAALREPRREPGRTLLGDEPQELKFTEAELHMERDLPPIVTLNGRAIDKAEPVDALGFDTDLATLAGFGRKPAVEEALPARGGFVEIVALLDGTRVLADALPPAARPPTDKAWGPLEFFAAVDTSGLTSPLVLTDGSRVEEVDAHFRRFLTQDFRLGLRLTPGFYRITVAP
jgi:hypothetical protein